MGRRPARIAACLSALAVSTGVCLAGPAGSPLAATYARLEASLLSKGALRTDRAAGHPTDADSLARDFVDVAFFSEYAGTLTSGDGARGAKPLLRWEEPVRVQVLFGASVDGAQRQADRAAIRAYAKRLSRITGLSMSEARGTPANFHILVVSEAERRSLRSQLPSLVPGISPWMVRTILAMKPGHLCMVVAEPHADRSRGYRKVVAVLRAEQPEAMRQACIEEELAQGLGLPNDCKRAFPSIFNDDQQYARLTARDEKLLKLLYRRDLRSGMTLAQAMPAITEGARALARR